MLRKYRFIIFVNSCLGHDHDRCIYFVLANTKYEFRKI
ncbi:hypothetical protein [Bacteroides thetaiotaomicron]|nr:hypothetical protein [Bacteroides thetaiotaomicron]